MNMDYGKEYFINRKFEDKTYWLAQQWISLLKPKHVFDYGCGEGFMVHAMNYLGVETEGYDFSKYAIDNAYGLSKGKIHDELQEYPEMDLVLCLDVMEHVKPEDEQEVINEICKLSNKYILLSICDTTLSKKYVDPTHINIRPRAYWEDQFKKRGWNQLKIPEEWYIRDQLYLFKKEELNGK